MGLARLAKWLAAAGFRLVLIPDLQPCRPHCCPSRCPDSIIFVGIEPVVETNFVNLSCEKEFDAVTRRWLRTVKDRGRVILGAVKEEAWIGSWPPFLPVLYLTRTLASIVHHQTSLRTVIFLGLHSSPFIETIATQPTGEISNEHICHHIVLSAITQHHLHPSYFCAKLADTI
jgi:hypothetical protein